MRQFVFFSLLYFLGLAFGLLYYRKIPLVFIALTAFFWGVLGWVILTLILSSLALPFTLRGMALIEIFTITGLAMNFRRKHGRNLQRTEYLIFFGGSLLFLLITAFSMKFNAANLTNDSYYMILYGQIIAYAGFFPDSTVLTPFAYGMFIPTIQSAAPFLRLDYLYAFQPIFSFSFLGVMFYLLHYALRKIVRNAGYVFFLSILGVFVFATTPGVLYHMFYIHTSFTAASYLFLAVVAFWLGQSEQNHTWLIFCDLALLAFSLVRTETPIFTLLVVVLMMKDINYRDRLILFLPLVLIMIGWQGLSLYLFSENEFAIVSVSQTRLFIGACVIFVLFLLFSRHAIIQKFIVPYTSHYLIAAAALAIIATFIAKPGHMLENLTHLLQNLFQAGGWGITWAFVFFLIIFSYLLPRLMNEEFFLLHIILFFVFVLALGFFRTPYAVRWTDSANRMSLHILPLAIFYLTIKYGQMMDPGRKATSTRLT